MYKSRSKYIARTGYIVPLNPESRAKHHKIRKRIRAQKQKNQALNIKVGNIVKGIVVEIKDIGAVIDIKGLRAFLHISQITSDWLNHPSEKINLGDELRLRVIHNVGNLRDVVD